MLSGFDVGTGDAQIAVDAGPRWASGIGLGMAPATEAIMGSLPPAKAGIGSAMNDVVREVAGTLGVAVLGSFLASAYAGGMDGAVAGLPADVGGGGERQRRRRARGRRPDRRRGGPTSSPPSNQAFIDAMSTTARRRGDRDRRRADRRGVPARTGARRVGPPGGVLRRRPRHEHPAPVSRWRAPSNARAPRAGGCWRAPRAGGRRAAERALRRRCGISHPSIGSLASP